MKKSKRVVKYIDKMKQTSRSNVLKELLYEKKKKNDIKHIIEWENEEEDLQLSLTSNNKRKRLIIE